jgi:hypothetical protein
MISEALLEFCTSIGIAESELIAADKYAGLVIAKDVEARQLQRITADSVRPLQTALGKTLNISVAVPGDQPFLAIRDGQFDNAANSLQELCEYEPGTMLRFELRLEKTGLPAQLGLDGHQFYILCFVFKEAFIDFLRGSTLLELDRILFRGQTSPTLIVVLNAPYLYAGQFLTIGNPKLLDKSKPSGRSAQPELEAQVREYVDTAKDRLSWLGFKLNNLTPLHFRCETADGEDANLAAVLRHWLLHLCVIYTANRTNMLTENSSTSFEAAYASSDRVAVLILESQYEFGENAAADLERFATWSWKGKPADRLAIIQNVMARELFSEADESSKGNYAVLATHLGHILDEAERNYRIYIDGRVQKHFEATKALVDYISETAKKVSETIDSVIKNLVESLLTTIGFVVATILAAVVKGDAQGPIFSIGMKAYAFYVLIFQLFYRMGYILDSYLLLRKESDSRITDYAGLLALNEENQARLQEPLKSRRKRFWLWFLITAFAFIVIFLILLSLSDPGELIRLNLISPMPTPTATSVP